MRRLCSPGIPTSVAVAAVGRELAGEAVSAGGRTLEDRVTDRALDIMRLRGGPVLDVGRAGNDYGGGDDAGRVAAGARGRHGAASRAHAHDESGRGDAQGDGQGASGALAAGGDADDEVIIVIDYGCGDNPQSSARESLADREEAASSAPTAVANSGASAIVVVDDDSHPAMEAGGETPPAAVDAWPEHDLSGSHLQTEADLMRTFPIAGTEPPARNSTGMAPARKPLALTYPLPPSSSGPLAAEVFILVDDRETAGSGATRSSFLSKLRLNPGLTDRVFTRRFPTGDAVLVARVTAAGAAAFEGAPAARTELMLDTIIERKTVADIVDSLIDGRVSEQAYYMAASGCSLQALVVEGDVLVTLASVRGMLAEVNKLLSSLAVTTDLFIQHTRNIDETITYYSAVVRHRGRRLGTADGLASWLQHHYVKDETAGVRAWLPYSLWEKRTKLMRGEISLQQLWALQLDIVPGVGLVRIDYIIEAGLKTPAPLAAAYAKVPSKEDGKMLLARIMPPPGGYRIGKKVSEYLYDLFTAKEYAGH